MSSHIVRHWPFLAVLLLLSLIGCDGQADSGKEVEATLLPGSTATPVVVSMPALPAVDLTLIEEDVSVAPLPLRAGFPFTITAIIHNNASAPATDVPVMVYIAAEQEEINYTSFLQLLTVTLPASQSLPVEVPVDWNFAGGEHRLWVQANRLPDAWQFRTPTWPEADTSDNVALLDLIVDPFDAYASDLCSGRVDVEIEPTDVLPEPDQQRVWVRLHNVGNQAVYNLPVVVIGDQVSGLAYTPAIPPCGGTAEVYVDLDRPLQQGESLTVMVNPRNWGGGLAEDNLDNNQVTVAAGLAPGVSMPPGSELEDYDFGISTADIETPEPWIALVTVHNLGTRDAAMVPIRVENQAGRKFSDAIPLVQGNGRGIAAIRIGYLWTRGGTLTFTINPEDAEGAYPEINRDNNVATLSLP
jgi:hypothetical protein